MIHERHLHTHALITQLLEVNAARLMVAKSLDDSPSKENYIARRKRERSGLLANLRITLDEMPMPGIPHLKSLR